MRMLLLCSTVSYGEIEIADSLSRCYSALFLEFVAFRSEYIVEEVERFERFEKM